MLEPRLLTTLQAFTACYGDSFSYCFYLFKRWTQQPVAIYRMTTNADNSSVTGWEKTNDKQQQKKEK
jgi:hypothetical protein